MFDHKCIHYCSKNSKNLPGCSLWYLIEWTLRWKLGSVPWKLSILALFFEWNLGTVWGHVRDVRARMAYWVTWPDCLKLCVQYPQVRKIVIPLKKSIAGYGKNILLILLFWWLSCEDSCLSSLPAALAVFLLCSNTITLKWTTTNAKSSKEKPN